MIQPSTYEQMAKAAEYIQKAFQLIESAMAYPAELQSRVDRLDCDETHTIEVVEEIFTRLYDCNEDCKEYAYKLSRAERNLEDALDAANSRDEKGPNPDDLYDQYREREWENE